jgi:hypothetical protein
MRFRDMFRRKEFFYTCLIVTVLFVLPAFLDTIRLYGSDMTSVRPPWYYFGLSLSFMNDYFSPLVLPVVCLVAIPLFSSMAYSYCCFDESRYGIKNVMLTKSSRGGYYISSAIAVFVGGFLVIFIPLVLNQLVYLAAVPFSAYASVQSGVPDYLDITYRNITYFAKLANNHHYLFNLLYCFIPSLVCALFGLLSFSISLLFKVNKFLLITLPLLIYLVVGYVLGQFFNAVDWFVPYMIMPTYNHSGMKLSHLIIVIVGLLLVNIGALFVKIRCARDEL